MSKKLHLNVETLSVNSFATQETREEARGTVHGQAKAPCRTEILSCPGTYHTCASFDRTC